MPQVPSQALAEFASEPQRPIVDSLRRITPQVEPVSIESGLNSVGHALDTQAKAQGSIYAANQMADFRVQTQAMVDQAKRAAPADGANFTPTVLKSFDQQANNLQQAVGRNPYAQDALATHIDRLRAEVQAHALQWEAQTGVQFRAQSLKSNYDKLSGVVEADPSQWQSAGQEQHLALQNSNLPPEERLQLARYGDEALSVAAANGLARDDPRGVLEGLNDPSKAHPALSNLTDPERETLRNRANQGLTKPVYDSLTNDDVMSAQASLNQNKDVMDAHTAYTLQRTIDAQIKEKKNEQKQDIADRFQDSMTGAEYGLRNPVAVTRAELDVLYPKDAQRHWDALQGMVAAGAKAKEYDQMTPEQINADVNSSAPTHGGPEAALAIKTYEIRANAADRSLKARSSDPAQFAIDSGAGWKPIDIAKPDDMLAQLRSRANTQGAVSEQTGVNTPLLSKAENKQFTGWLAAQPPADRVQTLTALRASMPNDQSYAALMKQIAPGSPLTAIAGSMMDRPAQGALPTWYNPAYTTPAVVPQRILEGEQILTAKDEKGIKSKFPMPEDKDLMPQFMAAVGGSNSDLFRGRPETLEASYAAFKAYYAAEASHQGVTNGVINPTIAAQAAFGVIGNPHQYGASNLVVPAGMDPTKFEGAVDAASKAALKANGYSDSDIAVLHGGGLRELGDTLGTGRYVIINGNGDALKSKDGKKSVIIDLNQQSRIPNALPPEEPVTQGRATTIGDRR